MTLSMEQVGGRLKRERARQGMSQRALAAAIGVSASLVSQIENGKVQPSVATLMSIVTQLDLSIDQLLRPDPGTGEPDRVEDPGIAPDGATSAGGVTARAEPMSGADVLVRDTGRDDEIGDGTVAAGGAVRRDDAGAGEAASRAGRPLVVQPGSGRERIELSTGVIWERLTPTADAHVDFITVTYPPGAASSDDGLMLTHTGKEYWYVLSGRLTVQVVFDVYEAGEGDSLAFECTLPHRFMNRGDVPVRAIVAVVHGA